MEKAAGRASSGSTDHDERARNQDSAARSARPGDHRARSRGRIAVVHARLSSGHRARCGRDGRGRGRQRLPRLLGRASPSPPPATPIPTSSRPSPKQAAQFLHMSGTDFYYDVQVRLAEELAAIVPIRGGVKSFFGNSGTEAIEASHQARAVRDRPRRASSRFRADSMAGRWDRWR